MTFCTSIRCFLDFSTGKLSKAKRSDKAQSGDAPKMAIMPGRFTKKVT